ncbi:circadian period extender Pex [Synechococcus sp. BIOS-U3-1]|uniref:helix-turn-helix transcriptional regulator n=1 Tax=Synechococcus sp. BIOS-U3-1 TaxID=1400865 RepID=UPI0016484BF8|nr:helix-turn-helix transcriptional regulator [Synechococcus sp. BIOS-U3-1]QNI57444.1 circadian period extender Pex [Synechococcus sp. BIOS-U3-1]|tara:strand:- start:268 stop:666 length:399 start_codon:yes stop_codon:yes gene_type:complete
MLTQRKPTRSCLADIEHYFRQPPPLFLDLELAVCWVLDCLLQNDSYPSGLLQRLQSDHPKLRLSETVLHQAVDFLEQQEMLDSYTKRCPSRGRPRRMLHLHQSARGQAERLMEPWSRWLHEHDPLTTSPVTT